MYGEIRVGVLGLTQGEVQANIAALAETALEDLHDPGLRQLKRLMTMGESQEHVFDAMTLLRDAPCSSMLVGEGHASAAVLMN